MVNALNEDRVLWIETTSHFLHQIPIWSKFAKCSVAPLWSLHWLKIKERIDTFSYLQCPYYHWTVLTLWSYLSSTTSQHSFFWCCHPCSFTFIFLSESQQPLVPPCLISYLEWTSHLLRMSPCHCRLICLSPTSSSSSTTITMHQPLSVPLQTQNLPFS